MRHSKNAAAAKASVRNVITMLFATPHEYPMSRQPVSGLNQNGKRNGSPSTTTITERTTSSKSTAAPR